MRKIVKYLLIIYQKSTIWRVKVCRFYPSCSQYSIDAVERYGAVKGLWMTIVRLLKCNQFFPGGYDPVK